MAKKGRVGRPGEPHEPARKRRGSLARSLTISIGIALILRAFVAEAYVIPSESMETSLRVGDQLFIDKAVYGLRIPFTLKKLTSGRSPRRGEIVVFADVRNPTGTPLIKRVIAIGGDTVEMRENRVYVNGHALARRVLGVPCRARTYKDRKVVAKQACRAFEEQSLTSPDDVRAGHAVQRYRVQQLIDTPPQSFAPRRIPSGHVFLLGDNRDMSNDSRYWGSVPHSHLFGRALFIFWSRSVDDGVRWSRIGQPLHD